MGEAELYKELGVLTKDKDKWQENIPYVSSLLTHESTKIQAKALWILVYEFQLFFVTAEKPALGLAVTVCSGLCNIILDALFIIVFKWGLAGAATASAITQIVGGVFPIFYFSRDNNSLLKLV